ncbi:MAG: adenylate/guanylate cyclase domain-containing protein, partial [Pseudomonadota bacterium]
EAVAEEGGVIVDFSGDGFLAAFNAPIEVEDPEARALRAALALLGRAERRRYGGLRLNIRAGLATGELAAGSVGGAGRRTYTIYGDPVNLAARLQERGKTEGRALVADRDTAEGAAAAGGPTLALLEANAAIRGRAAPADLFALP